MISPVGVASTSLQLRTAAISSPFTSTRKGPRLWFAPGRTSQSASRIILRSKEEEFAEVMNIIILLNIPFQPHPISVDVHTLSAFSKTMTLCRETEEYTWQARIVAGLSLVMSVSDNSLIKTRKAILSKKIVGCEVS